MTQAFGEMIGGVHGVINPGFWPPLEYGDVFAVERPAAAHSALGGPEAHAAPSETLCARYADTADATAKALVKTPVAPYVEQVYEKGGFSLLGISALPQNVCEVSDDGIRFVNLQTLIELKLASAKSAAHCIKDRADVLELIHLLGLATDFAEQLDPYVREDFRELAALPPPSEHD
jgi:hypothetical protein